MTVRWSWCLPPAIMLLGALLLRPTYAACPFMRSRGSSEPGDAMQPISEIPQRKLLQFNASAVESLNWKAVRQDIKAMLTKSESFWPADFGTCDAGTGSCTGGNYGGLMIRLAWHCAGSYRSWDGRGGCDGARIRFNPELSWADNTNLDKARKLLIPIKNKYGAALSWGDLIVLAGTTAIESMGGPVLGFCAGRIDDADGAASLPLGPTAEQELIAPCTPGQGNCKEPLGPTTVGLIYVNPEGPMGKPYPSGSVPEIRDTFRRMGMNDAETVALIGGGHAFGKTHGACLTGAGPNPTEDPSNPWPGTCGTGPLKGKGPNTFTSGFEGSWTSTPTEWSNEYFHNLLDYDWELYKGPGGHFQWRPKHKAGGNKTSEKLPSIMMLTADLALTKDPSYLALVKKYARDQSALDMAFSKAWYKLMTRDMGPITRCLGRTLPPAQPFQNPLPAPSPNPPDFNKVASDIKKALTTTLPASKIGDNTADGRPYSGALFATLAWRCAATFRATDKAGGCNGAQIRFSPQKDWAVNTGLDKVLLLLEPIKKKYPTLSYADLIVLAGTTALGEASGNGAGFKFCGGRSDAKDAKGTDVLRPCSYAKGIAVKVKDDWAVQGLTPREGVALAAQLRSPSLQKLLGYSGSWTPTPSTLSNRYFKLLLGAEWQKGKSYAGKEEYKAAGQKNVYMMPSDMVIKTDPALAAIAREYAADNGKFLSAFASAWARAMNADRFKGPAGSVCSA